MEVVRNGVNKNPARRVKLFQIVYEGSFVVVYELLIDKEALILKAI
jgi:hypothetical protein